MSFVPFLLTKAIKSDIKRLIIVIFTALKTLGVNAE